VIKTAICNLGDMLLEAQLTVKVDTKVMYYFLWLDDITTD